MPNNQETYAFEILLPKRKVFKSKKFFEYKACIKECEKKCKELHAYASDVKIIFTSDDGDTFIRDPELGELAVRF